MGLERYREIVPEWDRFLEAAGRPEPTTLRIRSARIPSARLAERLGGQGFRLEAVEGLEDVLRVVEAPYPASQTLEHWLGLFYIQQAVTTLAAPALAPGPGDRVLDLCAAPGGKTTHLADLTEAAADGEEGPPGCVVACDRDEKRLRGLLGNVYRQAHAGVLAVSADGRSLPGGAAFDRVLVDVPCTAEGNLRRHGGEPIPPRPGYREHVTGVQEALLRRAVGLARPGGTVLYVTCTFAPEENEGVVDRVLRDAQVELEPIALEVPHAPGLLAFDGRRFDPSLRRARRLYPHHLDSGGLFMARLRVRGDREGSAGWTPVPAAFPDGRVSRETAEERIEAGIRRMEERFGVAESHLRGLRWIVRKDSIWVHRSGGWPVPAWRAHGPSREVTAPGDPGDWRFLSLGLRALKKDARFGERPTNDFLRWLGPRLRRRVARLSRRECRRLLDGGFVSAEEGWGPGVAAIRVEGWVVGRGIVTRSGLLRHEIPKGRAKRLAEILDIRARHAVS